MKRLVVVALFVSLACGAVDPRWLGAFDVEVTFSRYGVVPSGPHDTKLYYGWAQYGAQRVDHIANHSECTKHYSTSNPCNLYFFSGCSVSRVYVDIPLEKRCFRDTSMDGVGPLPPDWMENFTFVGQETKLGIVSDHWKLFGDYAEYWDASGTGIPVIYSPGDKKQSWNFDVTTFHGIDQRKELFVLPDYCVG